MKTVFQPGQHGPRSRATFHVARGRDNVCDAVSQDMTRIVLEMRSIHRSVTTYHAILTVYLETVCV